MEMTCRNCGGELVEMNGAYYCWSCDAKYVMENGELRLLKCKMCIGDLIDFGDHYECDLCGKRYEKALPKPEPVVPEEKENEEKPAVRKDSDRKSTQKNVASAEEFFESVFGEGKFCSCCSLVRSAKKTEEIVTYAKFLKEEAVKFFVIIEDFSPEDIVDESELETVRMVVFEIAFAKFFSAMQVLGMKIYADKKPDLYKRKGDSPEEMIKQLNSFNEAFEGFNSREETRKELEYICAAFLAEIYNKAGFDPTFCKLFAEKAAEIFTNSFETEDLKMYCPNIAECIKFFESRMEKEQEELTDEYWGFHWDEYDELDSEKARLEEEREKLLQEEKAAIDAEEKKVEAVKKELKAVKDRSYENWNRSIRLKFFQKKEKERLNKEAAELVTEERSLENKIKYMSALSEKNIDRIQTEYSKKEVELLDRIFDIEKELERNHYPGEEFFVEIFNTEMEKVRT